MTAFRFDALDHTYTDLATGEEIPHITGMLQATGWIDDTWFTEESCERGQCVHRLTASFDLGALNVATCTSAYKPYLLAHVKLMGIVQPKWVSIEEPTVHPTLRFGGRPDRVGVMYRLKAVGEVKSGGPERSHQIQTALQAILEAPALGIPAHAVARFAFYYKPNGKFKVDQHHDRRDFDEAHRIIQKCCR